MFDSENCEFTLNDNSGLELLRDIDVKMTRHISTETYAKYVSEEGLVVKLRIEFPYFSFTKEGVTYKKYLSPDEMNVLIQDKFSSWETLV